MKGLAMNNVKLFEEKKVRTHWDEVNQKWYFSVIDVIQILTDSSVPKRYWSDLKMKLSEEGSEAYEKNRTVENVSSRWKKQRNRCC
jgi:hypothetical protein